MKNQTTSEPIPTADSAAAHKVYGDYRQMQYDYLRLVKEGNHPDLIKDLPSFVSEMVGLLAALAVTHPELLAVVARDSVAWPVLVTRHRPQGQDFAALADRIQLGADAMVDTSAQARWRPDAPLIRFLIELLHGGLHTKTKFHLVVRPPDMPRLTRRSLEWHLDDAIMPFLAKICEEEGGWDALPVLAPIARAASGGADGQYRAVRRVVRAALLELAAPLKSEPGSRRRRPASAKRKTQLPRPQADICHSKPETQKKEEAA